MSKYEEALEAKKQFNIKALAAAQELIEQMNDCLRKLNNLDVSIIDEEEELKITEFYYNLTKLQCYYASDEIDIEKE